MDEYSSHKASQAKDYLDHVRRLVASRAAWEAIIEQDVALMEGLRGIDYAVEKVDGGHYRDRMAELLDRLEENRRQHDASMAALVEAVEDAQERISRLDAPYSTLLLLRYVSDMPWREVSDRLHYSEVHVRQRMHEDALVMLHGHLPTEWRDPEHRAI